MAAIEPELPGRAAPGHTVAGLALGLLLLACWPGRDARGVFGSLGFMAASLGAASAFWCSLRIRDRACDPAAPLSLPSIALWAWFVRRAIRH